MINFLSSENLSPVLANIQVWGVGGGGSNAITNLNVRGHRARMVVANTDAQALAASAADVRIQLGMRLTNGLGTGSDSDIGNRAARESIEQIREALADTHICFITAGLGGGTGSGAAPVIAEVARELGILTFALVTTPFDFEGERRRRAADHAVEELRKHVDALLVVPNQNLFRTAHPAITLRDAFRMSDDVLRLSIESIADLLSNSGLINIGLGDIKALVRNAGKIVVGSGEASGPDRAVMAAQLAMSHPLLDTRIDGARSLILSISGPEDLGLHEVEAAADQIRQVVDPQAQITWRSAILPELREKVRVSVLAAGVQEQPKVETAPERSHSEMFVPNISPIGRGAGGARPALRAVPSLPAERPAVEPFALRQPAPPEASVAGNPGQPPLTPYAANSADEEEEFLLDEDAMLPAEPRIRLGGSDQRTSGPPSAEIEQLFLRMPTRPDQTSSGAETPSDHAGLSLFQRMAHLAFGAAA